MDGQGRPDPLLVSTKAIRARTSTMANEAHPEVEFRFEDKLVRARAGQSVAVALVDYALEDGLGTDLAMQFKMEKAAARLCGFCGRGLAWCWWRRPQTRVSG